MSWIDRGIPYLEQQQAAASPQPARPSALDWFALQDIASALQSPLPNVTANWPLVAKALDSWGMSDRLTTIAALATIGVETGSFAPIDELGDDAYFERMYGVDTITGKTLGNVYPGDGARFHGRGFIQVTGRANYRRYGWRIGRDLEGDPELAKDPDVAAQVLAIYFMDHSIVALANGLDWEGVRRAVNGGLNGWETFVRAVANLLALGH